MGSEDGETPASPPSGRHGASDTVCESCGTAIDSSDWYPVTKERGPDGALRLYPFCSEDCQDAWLDERGE